MLTVTSKHVYNIPNAIHGMRQPYKGTDKSDSKFNADIEDQSSFIIGEKDLMIAQNLVKLGSPHDKFLRQIFVSLNINAPLYFWKEMDQYKVSTVTNSESTMHTIMKESFSGEMFSSDDSFYCNNEMTTGNGITLLAQQIFLLNTLRDYWLKEEGKEIKKRIWRTIIQALPSSYMQARTWTGNYSNLRSVFMQRNTHRLSEWYQFIDEMRDLPYANELILLQKENV